MSFQPLLQSLQSILNSLLQFIPHFVNGLIILIAGYVISWLVRWVLRFMFRHLGLEQLIDRADIVRALHSFGVHAPLSEIIVQIVFYFLLLSFAIQAVSLMGLTAVAVLLQNILLFVPRAMSAAILLILGSLLARFLGETMTAVAEGMNITYGRALGKIIEFAIVAFVAVLAISTLGIDTAILTTSFTIIVAAAAIAIALTFAFGAREAARNVIAGYYVRQNFQPGQRITLGAYSGVVRSTVGAFTTLDMSSTDGTRRSITLPNALLLRQVATSEEAAPPAQTGEPPAPPAS